MKLTPDTISRHTGIGGTLTLTRFSALILMMTGCTAGTSLDLTASEGVSSRGFTATTVAGPGPCALDGWGSIEDPRRSLHVRTDGDDLTGDGTLERPFATVDGAWQALGDPDNRGWDKRGTGSPWTGRIAVGPGTFPTNVAFTVGHGLGATSKVTVEGCGAGETELAASDPDSPVVQVSKLKYFELDGVTLSGGTRTLSLDKGTRVTSSGVVIDQAGLVGVLVQGEDTSLVATDLEVHDTEAHGGVGFGIATLDGTVNLTGGGVYYATGVGLFNHGGVFELTDTTVFGTKPSGRFNGLGRGIHVQFGDLYMHGGSVVENADAGIFVLAGGDVVITKIVIDIVSAGIVIDFPTSGFDRKTGDGVVLYGTTSADLYDNEVRGAHRSGAIFAASDLTASGNVTQPGSLGGTGLFSQGGSQVDGTDAPNVILLPNGAVLDIGTVPPGLVKP